ncbi:unnamed protein product [Effrenium voratum]|nr:unnamed protein product [Effrenium voratum]
MLTSQCQIAGCRSGIPAWFDRNLFHPARDMSQRQVAVSACVGLWGGIFPVPPCTMPATLLCIMLYSAGVPKVQRFNVPMATVAVVINELSLPIDLALMPCFITLGQHAWTSFTGKSLPPCGEALQNLQAKPMETLRTFSTAFGLGIAVWASATPVVLGKIRVLGAIFAKHRSA